MAPNTLYFRPIGPQFSLIHLDPDMRFLGQAKPPLVVGLTGPTKVGKSQVAKMLVTEFEFQYASMSFPVKDLARKLGKIGADWEEIGNLADKLRREISPDYLACEVYNYIRKNFRGKPYIVIDGILHPAERKYFENTYERFRMISLTASQSRRIAQTKKWGLKYAENEIKRRDEREQVYVQRDDLFAPNLLICMEGTHQIEIKEFTRKYLVQSILDEIKKILNS